MEQKELVSYQQKFVKYLSQTVPGLKELVVESAQGCTLKTADGRVMLDMISGIGVNNIGHNHPAVVKAVKDQMDRYAHINVYGRFVLPEQVQIAERLANVAPGDLGVSFLTSTGTEANEGALKLARKYTGRPGFIAFERSFHGRTFGSLSVTWKKIYREPYEPLLPGVKFIPFDDLGAAEEVIDENIAAVIIEAVQGEAGVRIPSPDFLPGLQKICNKKGALLICDEVQGAMGRSGHWFSFENWGIQPDIVTMAKSLGGGLPLGAILSTENIFSTFLNPPLSHLTTFGGNPVCCAAAVANFDVIEREGLLDRAKELGTYLLEKLNSVRSEFPDRITDIRGLGLWCAFDVNPAESAQKVCEAIEKRGVIIGSMINSAETLRVMPPLIVKKEEIDIFTDKLHDVFAKGEA